MQAIDKQTSTSGEVAERLSWLTFHLQPPAEKYRTTNRSSYYGMQEFMFCFDITNRTSFSNIESWWKEVQRLGINWYLAGVLIGMQSVLVKRTSSTFLVFNIAVVIGPCNRPSSVNFGSPRTCGQTWYMLLRNFLKGKH